MKEQTFIILWKNKTKKIVKNKKEKKTEIRSSVRRFLVRNSHFAQPKSRTKPSRPNRALSLSEKGGAE